MITEINIDAGTSAGPLRKRHVERTEEMLHLEFPAEWIEFLQEHNGGVPKQKYFRVKENTKVITFFLCLDADYRESPTGQTDIGVVWSQIEDRLNDFLVPFAALFGGDFLCFNFEGESGELLDSPRVVLWNHDLSEEDEPHTTEVADNFEEFLEMLYVEE